MSHFIPIPASCNEEILLADFECMYKAFAKLPMIEVQVEGRKVEFLIDSGATNSVIKQKELPDLTVLCGKWATSRSATGHLVREPYTADLSCQTGDHSFAHAFLVTNTCPCNLLGRDLMCKLRLNLYR